MSTPNSPKCPECGNDLEEVRYPSGSMLNRDQFMATRAGDWFCERHTNSRGNRPYAYFWNSEIAASQPSAREVAPTEPEWTPVDKILPPEGKNVAFLVEDANVAIHGWATAGYYHSAVGGWWHGTPGDYRSCRDQRWTVTHWSYLPELPEAPHEE